mmetsp:Transcript_27327/g.87778  ORF Transcript_27327/g.87778 Transcript_27327/m.87778 type:complete len:160 (+) Transcript_27327:39-518(+)
MVLWIKLGFLAIKQVAKPVAARIKASARTSDTFRKLILAVGQRLHRNTLQLDRIAEGKGTATHVAPLRETVAVEKGSDFVAEMVIYTISATVLGVEYYMSQKSSAKKAAAEAEARRLHDEKEAREFRRLDARVTELSESVRLLLKERDTRQSWFAFAGR